MSKIFLSPPHMQGNELEYVKDVFDSNYITSLGEFVDKFEYEISQFSRRPSLALNSGTSAIHLALRLSNVSKNDLVLTSSFTFIGSVAPILYQGALPVFIDSDESWNISPNLLKKAIKNLDKKPKALIITHLYGQSCKMKEICEICNENNIILIEDSAESLGALYDNQPLGSFGDFGIYSFNGNKIITCGGGGMLLCKSEEMAQKARYYASTAREDKIYYHHLDYGYNYRLSNVLAAIGYGQMQVLDQRLEQKRQIFKYYHDNLNDILDFMPEISNSKGNRWLSTALVRKPNLNLKIIDTLNKNNIEARPLWKPMHCQPIFDNNLKFIDGISENFFEYGFCLPSGTQLKSDDQDRIINIIRKECNV